MIKEDFCSYEVSKLLEEKEFDEYCRSFYELGEPRVYVGSNGVCNNTMLQNESNECIARPTHQMAMKWLREKGIFIWIGQCSTITKDIDTQEYHPVVINNNDYIMEEHLGYIIGYSNAVEAALKYCLTKLI